MMWPMTDMPLFPRFYRFRDGFRSTACRSLVRKTAMAVALPCALAAAPAWANMTLNTPTATELPASVATTLKRLKLPASAVSVWVQDVDSSAPVLAYRAAEPRQMASVMKLIPTGTALRLLGPNFTWRTDVALLGPVPADGVFKGDIAIKGSGDPSLDGTRLLAWLHQWRQAGLRDIAGRVLLDDSVFELSSHDPSAFDGEAVKPYNAGPRSWLLAHGAALLQFQADAGSSSNTLGVSLNPPLAGVTIDSQVTLTNDTACGDWRSQLTLVLEEDRVTVRGPFARSCGPKAWPLLWPEKSANAYSLRAALGTWEALGGQWHGQLVRQAWPLGVPANEALSWTSPPVSEVIRDINKYSNNVMARQLFLTLGRWQSDGSLANTVTLDNARALIQAHVQASTSQAGQAPCHGEALQLDNGSGLSRTEGASAACMAAWLNALWRDPLMPEWLASLPIAGVDGTAKRVSAAEGRAHLKTGSLNNVMALAGVVQAPSGQRRILVAVINDAKAESGRPVMNALLEWASGDQPQSRP
jgi:serine-type D-Ala-D-Ala carboxypeptidase/endopeptidase (penicillin-binding protein 4)